MFRSKLDRIINADGVNMMLITKNTVAKRIGQKDLVVQVNPKDSALLSEDVLKRLSKKAHVELRLSEKTEDCVGGCIIQTADGKMIYNNTIDNRLEELKPTLRVEVAKILFKEDT
jgi:vacuolar-type H+-ATPase subunit E/Vma4